MSVTSIIDELRRRRVFRVAAFYGGIAFVIVQIIDGTFEVMGIPAWVSRFVIIGLALGFPVSMILAWVFDITPEGIVRTKGRPVNAELKAQPMIGNRALAVIAVVAIGFGTWGTMDKESADGPITLAVLPFQNYSEDDSDWFADGFTDVLTSQLALISGIKVISRTSTMHYKNTEMSATDVGLELGASIVLEGSILRAGEKVRITGQLIDTQSDHHLWANNYERDMEDVISLQSDVALAIARALKAELTPEEQEGLAAAPTNNQEAYDQYLQGLSLMTEARLHPAASAQGRLAQFDGAAIYFISAIDLDPYFADAHYQVVQIHGLNYFQGFGRDPSVQRLVALSDAMKRMETFLPDAWMTRLAKGRYHYLGEGDYQRALEYYEPLLKNNQNNAELLYLTGLAYRRVGRWEEALELLVQAADLNPRTPNYAENVISTYRRMNRYEEAERYFERLKFMGAAERHATRAWFALEKRGDIDEGWHLLMQMYEELGSTSYDWAICTAGIYRRDYEAVHAILDRTTALEPYVILLYRTWAYSLQNKPDSVQVAANKGLAILDGLNLPQWMKDARAAFFHGFLGNREQTVALVESSAAQMNISIDAFTAPSYFLMHGHALVAAGEIERGLDFIEEGMSVPTDFKVFDLHYIQEFDVIRDHPRFIAIVNKLEGGR